MRKSTCLLILALLFMAGMVVGTTSYVGATEEKAAHVTIDQVVSVQKYNRSIHVMAMLMVGFGFLMVFVKKYGRSAVTATYLLVSIAVPMHKRQGLPW